MKSPCIMGILNVTPDSFYGESRSASLAQALQKALQMVEQGAQIIDIGGESTRPGASPVSESEEINRAIPVVEALRKISDVQISVDTTKPAVARLALRAGANIINDISGLRAHPDLAVVVKEGGAGLILMHSRGTPETMQGLARYEDIVADVKKELMASVEVALKAGVPREKIWLDPGFGFAKLPVHNIEMLRRLEEFQSLGFPLVIGLSRKIFIGVMTGAENPEDRLAGSLAGALVALQNGADCLRVHDIRETVEILKFWETFYQ